MDKKLYLNKRTKKDKMSVSGQLYEEFTASNVELSKDDKLYLDFDLLKDIPEVQKRLKALLERK